MKPLKPLVIVAALHVATGCGGVASEDDARIASLGLDAIVSRVLGLGFDGFNAANSANIPPQSADGDESGTVDVAGQVDQGNSANKGMRLQVTLVEYADDTIDDPETDDEEALELLYSTPEGAPLAVDLQLRDIPTGTLSGTVAGDALIEGDLAAEVEVSLSLAGAIEDDGAGGTRRAEGTTTVTGTVTSANGGFDVDFEI
jgi:hypothetical protein